MIFLGKELRTAHDKIGRLGEAYNELKWPHSNMKENHSQLIGENQELSGKDREIRDLKTNLKTQVQVLETSKVLLQKRVLQEDRLEGLRVQLEDERMSVRLVKRLEKEHTALHLDHDTAKRDLVAETTNHEATKQDLTEQKHQAAVTLTNSHVKEKEISRLRPSSI